MAIREWCGKPCHCCTISCGLDESMPCSPDCENLNPDGTRNIAACFLGECDAYEFGIGYYVFDTACGETGFIVDMSSGEDMALIQYLTGNGAEEDWADCRELENLDRPDAEFDIQEACQTCAHSSETNNCIVSPGEYCKRYHRFKEGASA